MTAEHTLSVLGLKERLYNTIVIGSECKLAAYVYVRHDPMPHDSLHFLVALNAPSGTRAKPFPDPYLEGE